MSKTTMNMAKTVGIGLIAGTTAMAVGSMVMKKNQPTNMRKMKKSAGKAVHKVGEIIGSMETMLG